MRPRAWLSLALSLAIFLGLKNQTRADKESVYTGATGETATNTAPTLVPTESIPKTTPSPSPATNASATVVAPADADRVATMTTADLKEFADLSPDLQALIANGLALTRLNLKYQYGSSDPQSGGMDCSGTMYYLLQQAGLKDVPRDASGLYRWVWKNGHVEPVISAQGKTFELDRLKPGDLLFWIGTYDVQHDPPISHVMLYIGTNRRNGGRVMLGASEGRRFEGKSRYGVSVFDFKLTETLGKPDSTGTSKRDFDERFIGYGSIPGL